MPLASIYKCESLRTHCDSSNAERNIDVEVACVVSSSSRKKRSFLVNIRLHQTFQVLNWKITVRPVVIDKPWYFRHPFRQWRWSADRFLSHYCNYNKCLWIASIIRRLDIYISSVLTVAEEKIAFCKAIDQIILIRSTEYHMTLPRFNANVFFFLNITHSFSLPLLMIKRPFATHSFLHFYCCPLSMYMKILRCRFRICMYS